MQSYSSSIAVDNKTLKMPRNYEKKGHQSADEAAASSYGSHVFIILLLLQPVPIYISSGDVPNSDCASLTM